MSGGLLSPFDAGVRARVTGRGIETNPFLEGVEVECWNEWRDGWFAADAVAEVAA
jgi:hypothetical protein